MAMKMRIVKGPHKGHIVTVGREVVGRPVKDDCDFQHIKPYRFVPELGDYVLDVWMERVK